MTRSGAAANIVAAAGTVAALASLFGAAWLVPALATAVIWPLLFVVPGWTLVAVTRPRVGAPGRLGLAIVLSVAISAHLVYWLAQLGGGYGRATVFVAAAVLALPVPLAVLRGGLPLLAGQLRGVPRAVRRNRGPLALALLAALFVGAVLEAGLWKATPTGVAAGGSNWSDLSVHLSIAQSLNAGNFPPQVPFFAGVPLTYHWFADFHAAIAAAAAGSFAVPAFVVSSAILAGALALLVHGLAHRLLRGRHARRAALIAAALVVFGGGLGWVRWVADIVAGHGDPIGLMLGNSYDNSWYDVHGQPAWPYFRIPSVMGTGLLVHRATTFGLPILVGAILLLAVALPPAGARRRGWRDRPGLLLLAGLLGALLAPFHFFFFPAFWLLALLYVVVGRRLVDSAAPRNALALLAPLVGAAPFALTPVQQASRSGALRAVAGWESAPMADGPAAVVFFYLTNLGVPFGLALAALVARRTPWRLFLGAWVVALFAIPNLLQFSAIAFDMNKYFQAMWIAVAVLAAWLIRRWTWPAVALVLLLSVPSPLLVAGWTAWNREQLLDWNGVAAAEWIASNTPEESIFATDGWLNSPTDAAGRLRLLTYTPYVANLGYDPGQRAAQVYAMYCAGDATLTVRLMRQLGADYLLDAGRAPDCATPTDFGASPELVEVYANPGLRIYGLADGVGEP